MIYQVEVKYPLRNGREGYHSTGPWSTADIGKVTDFLWQYSTSLPAGTKIEITTEK